MRNALLILVLLAAEVVSGQEITDKDFNSFYREHITGSKGILIVNFWATWCKPCIQELPDFERINSEMQSDEVNVCLVNLDFNSKYKVSATEFINNKMIRSKVIHLNDSDPDKWINKVDSSWSGAIPATVFYKDGEKVFFKEGEIAYDELITMIDKLKNK